MSLPRRTPEKLAEIFLLNIVKEATRHHAVSGTKRRYINQENRIFVSSFERRKIS
jgi:hypothetical protein